MVGGHQKSIQKNVSENTPQPKCSINHLVAKYSKNRRTTNITFQTNLKQHTIQSLYFIYYLIVNAINLIFKEKELTFFINIVFFIN